MRSICRVSTFAVLSLSLSACATRGRLAIDCPNFERDYVHNLPYSPLEQQIRHSRPDGDAGLEGVEGGGPEPSLAASAQTALTEQRARAAARRGQRGNDEAPEEAPPISEYPSVLLLSGGGQWGAFGAGLLNRLAESRSDQRPNPVAITGVSTGSLQMLFIGAGLDDPAMREALRIAYSPHKESDVVNRGPAPLAVITGSISGLKPLKGRIEDALCPDAALKADRPNCPMLEKLHDSQITMLAGFVEARSSDFKYASINDIAQSPRLTPREKRSCIVGAALASVAMPVFFQQVTVDGKTYYDGGVRQSVFAAHVQKRVKAEIGEQTGPTPILVLRNGPTDTVEDPDADGQRDALTSALRAEAIIVNQVEVSSVAGLRIENPQGKIGFASADGWMGHKVLLDDKKLHSCVDLKNSVKGAQFIPDFMRCMMDYGRERADQKPVWTELMTIGPAVTAEASAPRPLARND